MNYVKTNLLRNTNPAAGRGGDKKYILSVFDWDDVASIVVNEGLEVTSLVFNPGKYAVKVYADPSSIKLNSDSSGDVNSTGIEHTVEIAHPGDTVAVRLFRSNWTNRTVGVIAERCSDNTKTLYGSVCAPLGLQFKGVDDKDKKESTLTFKSMLKGPDALDATLISLTYDTVKGTAAADAVTVDVAVGEGEYQLTTGATAPVAITNLVNASDNMIYSLLGSGGAHPSTITSGGNFILKNGIAWTAISGSKITFRTVKDGATSFKHIEVSRF